MGKKGPMTSEDKIQEELENIKWLLVLALIKGGASQDEVATALAVDRSVVSKRIPARKVKPFGNKDIRS